MKRGSMSQAVSISLALVLAIILSTMAAGQASSSPNMPSAQTSPATPSPEQPQSEPSQQNPAATPAPEPQQSSPSQSAPPASAQSNQPRSIDEELQLTPDQKQKIAAVVDDENRQIGQVRDDHSMTLEQKQQKVMQIRQAGTPKIKAILTPDQLQKLAVIQQRMREQNNSQNGGNSGNTQAPPQR